jgi:hypothetical protein
MDVRGDNSNRPHGGLALTGDRIKRILYLIKKRH